MIVHNFDVLGACRRPPKAHTELIVHSDAVLADAVPLERFKPISRRHPQVFQPARDLQLAKLASRDRLDAHEPRDPPALRKRFRVWALERLDHVYRVTPYVINVKRDAQRLA